MTESQQGIEGSGESCARCLSAQATHHICQIINGQKETLALCGECAGKWSHSFGMALPDVRDARCDYCDAPAFSGGFNQEWEKQVRGREFHFSCLTCFENLNRLLLKILESMPPDLQPEAQIAELCKAIAAIDQEVRALANRMKN